jgi:hypothetical protein
MGNKWDKLNKELDDALEAEFGTEEPKQETLKEAAEKWVFETNGHKWSNNDDTAGDNYGSFKAGAKWQAERSYSEEETIQLLIKFNQEIQEVENVKDWFEQFKKRTRFSKISFVYLTYKNKTNEYRINSNFYNYHCIYCSHNL